MTCLDGGGNVSWSFRTTDDMNEEELLGAPTVRTDLLRGTLLESYVVIDEDDD